MQLHTHTHNLCVRDICKWGYLCVCESVYTCLCAFWKARSDVSERKNRECVRGGRERERESTCVCVRVCVCMYVIIGVWVRVRVCVYVSVDGCVTAGNGVQYYTSTVGQWRMVKPVLLSSLDVWWRHKRYTIASHWVLSNKRQWWRTNINFVSSENCLLLIRIDLDNWLHHDCLHSRFIFSIASSNACRNDFFCFETEIF